MTVLVTIEARMRSSRLPGKVLLESAGKSMIERQVDRLRSVPGIDKIVVATTVDELDDAICLHLDDIGVSYFRGSELDVLGRVVATARAFEADTVVQTTGDCPLIDPLIVERCLQAFLRSNFDIVSNGFVRTFPDGMDVSVLSYSALCRIEELATQSLEREHVLFVAAKRPQDFSRLDILADPDLIWPDLGLTLDTIEDFELLTTLINQLEQGDKFFSCRRIINFLRQHPELASLNAGIVRKGFA